MEWATNLRERKWGGLARSLDWWCPLDKTAKGKKEKKYTYNTYKEDSSISPNYSLINILCYPSLLNEKTWPKEKSERKQYAVYVSYCNELSLWHIQALTQSVTSNPTDKTLLYPNDTELQHDALHNMNYITQLYNIFFWSLTNNINTWVSISVYHIYPKGNRRILDISNSSNL